MPFLDANTNTSGGLYVMMRQVFNETNGDRPDVPDTAIVITDGRSTYDSNLTIPFAEEAKRRGIHIIGLSPPPYHRIVGCIKADNESMKIPSDSMWYWNNELMLWLGLGSWLDSPFKYGNSHCGKNHINIMLTHEHADSSSLFL